MWGFKGLWEGGEEVDLFIWVWVLVGLLVLGMVFNL